MIDSSLLKYYREKENLKIKDLAKKIHISKKIIEKWENAELEPMDKDIEKLCKLYRITKEDLIIKEKKKNNLIISIILFICGIGIGIVLNEIAITIILPIILVIILNSIIIIKSKYELSKKEEGPKSLFGISLRDSKKNRYKYYLLESLILSSSYILFNMILRMFDFTKFIINVNLTTNESINYLIIWVTTFILLTSLAFLIELIFGEFMVKKENGGNS